jgi:hypothetical protein
MGKLNPSSCQVLFNFIFLAFAMNNEKSRVLAPEVELYYAITSGQEHISSEWNVTSGCSICN